jgi:Ca2+/Na+ antiporter
MSMNNIIEILAEKPTMLAAVAITVFLKLILDFWKYKLNSEKVEKAEKQAFDLTTYPLTSEMEALKDEHNNLKQATEQVKKVVEDNKNAIAMGRLFNLYSKQIEKYQQETRTRASWSFVFAIISMFLGMAFVFWGGTFILSDTGTDKVAAGAAISAIGGGISAYITKTFLDVHKLSITQLNKYFKQPVINDNILMAQRLADDVDDTEVRKESYKKIIDSITGLIVENGKEKSS